MAQQSSNIFRNIGLGIIIVLLVIGLSIFGFTDIFQPKAKGSVALVGKNKITERVYTTEFKRRLDIYNRENNTSMTAAEAYERGFNQTVMSGLLTEAAMDLDADILNIGVARTVVRESLSDIEVFRDEMTGEFSEEKVNEFFAANRRDFNRDDFEASTVRELRRQQSTRAVISGIKAPLAYAEQRYKFLTEQRLVKILTLTRDSVSTPEAPSDEVLQTFIAENEADYTQPEYRRFTILRIENFDTVSDIEIDEADVVATYEADLADGKLGELEIRSVTYLPVTNKTLAEDVKQRLADGESFADAATAVGVSPPIIYTEVRPVTIADPRVAEALFEAETGEIISGEGTLGGAYVARLDSITPAVKPSLEAERERIVSELTRDQAEAVLFERFGKLQDVIETGAAFEDAGKESGVSVASIDYISRLGVTRDDKKLSGIGALTGTTGDDEILRQLFTAEPGFPTEFFETSTGGYAMIRVDDVIAAKLRSFDDVKEKAKAVWTAKQIDEKLADLARTLATRIRDGETLEQVAASVPAGTNIETRTMVRTNRSPGLSPEVLSQLLTARQGEVVQGNGTDPLTRKVAIVARVSANTDRLSGGFADAMQTQSTEDLSSDIQMVYRQDILRENPVQMFEDRMSQINGVTE
ncbi:SurA N-terminal domain-containing protein [Robiginitomaculum antarcticum]|uniref:SurA N-terminal domain-containing protein n=1 Tax=Robiginitomaculum antarcticum TaxID=437507 RepID=UPI000365EF10|nr:SurA N-terminal domain-containing protein [Robiginitomaculum antarcticum]